MKSSSTHEISLVPSNGQNNPNSTGYGTTDTTTCPDETEENQGEEASFIESLQKLKDQSVDPFDLLKNVLWLIFAHYIWSFIMFCTLAIPVTMLAIGGLHIKDCPRQPVLPIIIIVMGALMLLSIIFHLVQRFNTEFEIAEQNRITCVGFLTIFMDICYLVSFIAACVFVYKIYPPSYDSSNCDSYCDKTLYLFSFWVLNSIFIAIGAIIVIVVGGCCCALLC